MYDPDERYYARGIDSQKKKKESSIDTDTWALFLYTVFCYSIGMAGLFLLNVGIFLLGFFGGLLNAIILLAIRIKQVMKRR